MSAYNSPSIDSNVNGRPRRAKTFQVPPQSANSPAFESHVRQLRLSIGILAFTLGNVRNREQCRVVCEAGAALAQRGQSCRGKKRKSRYGLQALDNPGRIGPTCQPLPVVVQRCWPPHRRWRKTKEAVNSSQSDLPGCPELLVKDFAGQPFFIQALRFLEVSPAGPASPAQGLPSPECRYEAPTASAVPQPAADETETVPEAAHPVPT